MSLDTIAALDLPPAFAAFRTRFVCDSREAAGGTWIYRQTTPSAPLLLALPGALGTGDVFYRTATAFSDRYNVVTLSYPATDDAVALADGVGALIDAFGAGAGAASGAIVLSSSLGGYVAQVLAARHPQKLRLVILGNTFRDPTSQQARWPSAEEFAKIPAEQVLADAVKRLREGSAETPMAAELKAILLSLVGVEQSAEAVRAARLAVLRATIQPKLGLDPARIALIDDDADPIIAAETRADLRNVYAGCRHERIQGGGHYPSILAPDLYQNALAAILAAAGC